MSTYFAFGSNSNAPFLRSWLESRGVEGLGEPQPAILRGHRLRTNYFSSSHQAGAANIERSARSRVEGVVYEITPAIRAALRRKEGWPRRYEEVDVAVEIVSTGEIIQTITYIVTPEFRVEHDLPVTAEYRQLILEAAEQHRLSPAYQRFLRRFLKAVSVSTAAQF